MKMQKLLTMAPAEIAFRGRQAMLKTAERVGHGSRSQVQLERDLFTTLTEDSSDTTAPSSLYRSGDINNAMKRLQANFQRTAGYRFFAGASAVQAPDLMASYLPRIRSEIVRSADAVCAGNFHTLGYGRLSFYHTGTQPGASNAVINWHLDAVSGTVSPLMHWSRINALDYAQVGDSKVVWELNRHQWLIQLGLAWQLTGDSKYTALFCQHMQAWMRANPTGYGINWSSSLEVAYRLISWCWALVLFKDSSDVSAQFQASMMSWLRTHADHVERFLSTYYSPNTHLTGEALALYYAGVLFPEIGGAKRWRTLGRKILLQQFDRQVHKDGVYFEQSTRYQYYTLEIYLQFMILSQRNGETLPDGFSTRVQAMVDFLLNLRRPDGTVPQIGDTDGGALLSLVHRQPGDYQALFAVAAAVFEREDYAWAAGDSTAELICLLGPVGHYRFMALKQKAPPVVEASLFPDGGYLIMRDGWRTQGHQLILDVGPLGCSDSAAHGHADLLSIQCSAFGDNYLIDPGTGTYTSEPQWRNFFRSSQAHSTVSVDGQSQAMPNGPFSWHGRRPQTTVRSCWSTPNVSMVDANTNAWSDRPDPVLHRRRIAFIRHSYWIVVDDLSAAASHDYDLRFQFAPIAVRLEREGWLRAIGKSGSCLLMHVSANRKLTCQIQNGLQSPPAGWVSENYGQRSPAPALSCTASSSGPMRFVTVLYPQPDAAASPPALRLTPSNRDQYASCLRIQIDQNHNDRIVITDDSISVNEGTAACVV